MQDTFRCLSTLLAVSALLCPFASVRGDEDEADEMEADAVVVQQPQIVNFVVQDQNFEMSIFGNHRNAPGARTHLDTLLTLQLDEIERICKLTDAQARKLRLAGRGDVRRFFDRVDEKRKVFQVVKTDQVKYQQLYQELFQVQRSLQQGFFGEGSLFSKTIKTTLDEKQAALYANLLHERELYQYATKLDLVVDNLDNLVGLDAAQRARLRTLVREEIRPPKKHSQYDTLVVMLQLVKLPEARLKAIFNEGQRRLISSSPQFVNARNMETMLIQNGYLPDDPAKTEPAGKPR